MKVLAVLILTLLFFDHVSSQEQTKSDPKTTGPSPVIVIGVLSAMFTLILLTFGYVKFCFRSTVHLLDLSRTNFSGLVRSRSGSRGFEKSVIDSLPFFRFSSLRGSKQGLECSICISKYQDMELLRLLPRCKHAFHTSCIDQWLESHSTCPLCRYQYNSKDFTCPASSESQLRFPEYSSNLSEDPNLEIFIQREQDERENSSFDGLGTGKRYFSRGSKGESLIRQANDPSSSKNSFHRFKHKIIVSDYVIKKRWSDISSLDLQILSSEMLHLSSSQRFSPSGPSSGELEGLKLGRSSSMSTSYPASASCHSESSSLLRNNSSVKRSMSEILSLSRFSIIKNKNRESPFSGSSGRNDDRARRLWLCTVRRTVGLFGNGDRESINDAQLAARGTDHSCV